MKNIIGSFMLTFLLVAGYSSFATIMPASEIVKLNTCELVKFNTSKLPSSYGLDVDVYYPKCMKFEEGGFQTHTIAKASYEWNDFDVLVQISAAGEDCGKLKARAMAKAIPEMTREDIAEIATAHGGSFLDGGVVNIREVKVLWFDTFNRVNRMGEKNLIVIRQYVIPADSGKLFNFRFSVGSMTGVSPLSDFNALKPLIQKCAVALTLRQYDQFHKTSPAWQFWK